MLNNLNKEENDIEFIHQSPILRPPHLIMSDLHWKFLVRNVIRGKNILMAGYTGAGKCLEGSTIINVKINDELYNKIIEKRK